MIVAPGRAQQILAGLDHPSGFFLSSALRRVVGSDTLPPPPILETF